MIRLLTIIALLLAFVPLSSAETQDDWYDIELIIFEHKATPGAAAESWIADPGAPDLGQAIELAPPLDIAPHPHPELLSGATVRMPYRKLDASELKLGRLFNRLTVSGVYMPLLHVAWRQPANPSQPVRGVHVSNTPIEQADDWHLPSSDLFIDTRTMPAPASNVAAVDGIVSLQRTRFLHMNLDLLLSDPAAEAAESSMFSIFSRRENRPKVYRLQAQRRIRVNEVHYFDHPVIGVIVQVSPYVAQKTD